MYDAPVGKNAQKREDEALVNKDTGYKKVMLPEHPKGNFIVTKIDLDEVAQIEVLPNTLFIYQDTEKKQRASFVQLTITSKDTKKSKKKNLIDANKKQK